MAAIDEGRLAGFLATWVLPAFRGRRAVFSPEWANGARAEDSRRICEEMYTQLSASWVEDGCLTQLISSLANDGDGMEALHWLGFGMIAADAVHDHPRRQDQQHCGGIYPGGQARPGDRLGAAGSMPGVGRRGTAHARPVMEG